MGTRIGDRTFVDAGMGQLRELGWAAQPGQDDHIFIPRETLVDQLALGITGPTHACWKGIWLLMMEVRSGWLRAARMPLPASGY